jgi:hypothetical protein
MNLKGQDQAIFEQSNYKSAYNFLLGKPPALPGDSQRLTFPGFDIL